MLENSVNYTYDISKENKRIFIKEKNKDINKEENYSLINLSLILTNISKKEPEEFLPNYKDIFYKSYEGKIFKLIPLWWPHNNKFCISVKMEFCPDYLTKSTII